MKKLNSYIKASVVALVVMTGMVIAELFLVLLPIYSIAGVNTSSTEVNERLDSATFWVGFLNIGIILSLIIFVMTLGIGIYKAAKK